ncbi:MAG TPA: hypothetical protein VJZ00_12070 [Thermoanaerobaculia bacterium]|nr:hypothetical protein [Thermoanaerobaculia bacterium]
MNAQRGRSCAEVFLILIVFSAFLFGIWLLLHPGKKEAATPAKKVARYRSMTTPDGVIPLKALIAAEDGARVYSDAREDAKTARMLDMFSMWFPYERRGAFLRVGASALSDKTIGWVKASDVVMWTTKEGIAPNYANKSRRAFDLWKDLSNAGNYGHADYRENEDFDIEPYPVLASANGHYNVAVLYQNEEATKVAVDTAWTANLEVPAEARFYYLTTRPELKEDLEQLTTSILELNSGTSAEHPILQLLKKHVDVAVARDITTDSDDIGVLRKILRELRGPQSLATMQPAEIRRDAANMQKRLGDLKRFYEERDHWNEQGFGWLPSELWPSN